MWTDCALVVMSMQFNFTSLSEPASAICVVTHKQQNTTFNQQRNMLKF